MIDVQYNVDLARHTTFGISAKCDIFAEYDTVDDLVQLLCSPELQKVPIINIGEGSNILFVSDFNGAVLHSRIYGIEIISDKGDEVLVRAGSGVCWDSFVGWAAENSLYGIENLSSIPGTVGASAIQNIGAYGVEAKDVIFKVEAYDTVEHKNKVFSVEECLYGYRDSMFKHTQPHERYIVTHVQYRLSRKKQFNISYGALSKMASDIDLTLHKVRDFITQVRNKKLPDPAKNGSAGSFFKNPVVPTAIFNKLADRHPDMPHYPAEKQGFIKLLAGWLIEHAGLKGFSIGGAVVWPLQCLVIANAGNADASDVISLMEHIQQCVKNEFQVNLFPEVLLIPEKAILKK